jgi:hypothetical protein
MPESDSVTLRLDGALTVAVFARAAQQFNTLLDELSREASATDDVEWVLEGLAWGSAMVAAGAVAKTPAGDELATGLVVRYLEVADTVRTDPAADRPTYRAARELIRTAAAAGSSVVFETADGDVLFPAGEALQAVPARPEVAFGTVVGRVYTLQRRRRLKFVVWDAVLDKPITCYLTAGQEDLMRDAWGHLVEVSGMVTRDPATGWPMSVRRVTHVEVYEDPDRYAFLAAQGAIRPAAGSAPSEEIIRRMRDGD